MRAIIYIIISSLIYKFDGSIRTKRTLIWPPGNGIVQAIIGAGIPVDLQDETVIVGIVMKAHYRTPQNVSLYTNPGVVFARRKKRAASTLTLTRWDVYKMLQSYMEIYGYGGKGCILRTICELSAEPIDRSTGLIEEILHTLFTPSTTGETVQEHGDNEYYAAERIGRTDRGQCEQFLGDCRDSFVDMFTGYGIYTS